MFQKSAQTPDATPDPDVKEFFAGFRPDLVEELQFGIEALRGELDPWGYRSRALASTSHSEMGLTSTWPTPVILATDSRVESLDSVDWRCTEGISHQGFPLLKSPL